MQLSQLLGVQPGITALTGGGGKTTALYTLARELAEEGSVICATTTRIFPPDHLPVLQRADLQELSEALERRRCLCVGVPAPEGKLAQPALPLQTLAGLARYVLVEADGSRGLPVKAHLDHEPVIPLGTDLTVGIVGASGFGRPVREAVHRWERFCALTGAAAEEPVTEESVARLLEAEGLADKIFINQAESARAMTAARHLAERLNCPVFAGSLQGGIWTCLS